MTEDILKRYGFIEFSEPKDKGDWFLEYQTYYYLWFVKGIMYIAGVDTPNENHAIPVRCNDEQDLKEIINILTRT